MKKELSRRDFLMGVGVAGTTVAASALVGCGPSGGTNASAAGAENGEVSANAPSPISSGTRYTTYANPDNIGIVQEAQSEEEVAAVFVGSGIGGTVGAMICAEQMPDKKILLLEKQSSCGGNSNFAERNAPKPSVDWETALRAATEKSAESNYLLEARLYAERDHDYGKNSAWMYLKHKLRLRESEGFTHMYEGGNGTIPLQKLRSEIENDSTYANLEVRTETRATALLLEDEYTCKGVQIQNSDGSYTNIYADAVVLTCGGMSNNLDLLQNYSGQDLVKCETVSLAHDGDGHLMAEQTAHGKCKTIALSSLLNHVKGFAFDSILSVAAGQNYTAVFVNQEGERVVNEASLKDATFPKVVEQQGRLYSIMGTGMLNHYQAGGLKRTANFGEDHPYIEWDATADIEANKDNENMIIADTLEELAEKIDVPAEAFLKTIERYESDCAAGEGDTLFGKDAEWMLSLGEGPYYAFRLTSCMLNSNNGIRVNHNSQVVDPFYKPIEGLYAAGICVSGFSTEIYYVATCQSGSTWGGSKAARHLIENRCGGKVSDDWFGDTEYISQEETPVGYDDFKLGASA